MCLAMQIQHWRLLTLAISALSLGPSFAHVLEAYPRLSLWAPELWRETTVFNGQYLLFAIVGAPLDIGAIVFSGILAYLSRDDGPARWWAALGALLAAASLLVWFGVVARANSVLATWQPGPIAADFAAVQKQWEFGNMAVASLKLLSFASLVRASVWR
jgi:hypothetical protein